MNYPVLAGDDTAVPDPGAVRSRRSERRRSRCGPPTGTVPRDLPVLPVSPAIMVSSDGAPMLWDADTGLPIDFRNVAHSNGRMQIWATGLGRVRPDWPTGMQAPAENTPAVVAQIRAFLDRSSAASHARHAGARLYRLLPDRSAAAADRQRRHVRAAASPPTRRKAIA